jgi:hypothetical protein
MSKSILACFIVLTLGIANSNEVIYSEDFNDCDISDWEITLCGTLYETVEATSEHYVSPPCGLFIRALGYMVVPCATGRTPDLNLDTEQDYEVSFWFKKMEDNVWIVRVMENWHIRLKLHLTDNVLSAEMGDGSTVPVKELNPDQWYHIVCKAHPSLGTYDIFIDGDSLLTATFRYPDALQYLTVGVPSYYIDNQGHGYWDDIIVTGQPLFACGDANTDGSITSGDGYTILSYIGGGENPTYCWTANVNGDLGITPADGYYLLNHLGDPIQFPLGCAPCEF